MSVAVAETYFLNFEDRVFHVYCTACGHLGTIYRGLWTEKGVLERVAQLREGHQCA